MKRTRTPVAVLESASVHPRPVSPATWIALGALVLLLGALSLFLMGCDKIIGLTEHEPCGPGEVLVGEICQGRHPNHYVCACDCTGFGIGAGIRTAQTVNVRQDPAGTVLPQQAPNGAPGSIIGGPVQATLNGVDETWWQVDFATVNDGWVVQRFLTVVQGVSVLAKEIDVCVPPLLNGNLDGGHKPTVPEINDDCSTDGVARVESQLVAITGQQLPPQTQCTCGVQSDPLPWVAECDAPCSNPTGVCTVAGMDPPTPTPDPLPAVVFATTSVCEVTGEAEIHIPGEGVKFTAARGFVQLHGRPCLPGQACSVGISYQLSMDPISFPVRFHKDPKFIELGVSGASEPAIVNLVAAEGFPFFGLHVGQVPTGTTLNSIRGRRDGLISHLLNLNTVMVGRNGAPLQVAVDWTGKHCLIDGNIAQSGGSVEDDDGATQPIKVLMTVGGQFDLGSDKFSSRIVNQPPRAHAGPNQTVECTSPQGAPITLNASLTTDPDNNIAFFVWRHDSETGAHVTEPSFTPTLTTQQGLIEKTYHLRAVDRRFAADNASVKVRVVDTTPPHTIDCQAPAVIPKKDTPITFTAAAEDTCGASSVVVEFFECFKVTPEGRIKDNPSCQGSIQGNTLTIGNSAGADLIRWRLRAADGSANAALKTCEVSVSP